MGAYFLRYQMTRRLLKKTVYEYDYTEDINDSDDSDYEPDHDSSDDSEFTNSQCTASDCTASQPVSDFSSLPPTPYRK